MPIHQKFCFKDFSGEDIYLFTLTNKQDTTVCISNYGAIISSFKVKMAEGSMNDIVLGFDDVEGYLSERYLKNYAYLGAACGRYANRIKNARFVIDGTRYELTRNMGNDILHGGKQGFDKKTWTVVSIQESSLEFKLLSKDGEEGFPGNLETLVRFDLNDDNELSYEFVATTDKATAVNLTHHSYFNLNNGNGTILDHEVRIAAKNILQQDEGLVCNGEYVPVSGTKYDFTDFKPIAQEYDQCFVIDNKSNDITLVAEARSHVSGITLEIYSTEPAVQFYTGQGLNIPGAKNGIDYKAYSGFCLETHKHPNAINLPNFPNTILKPGAKYYQKNVYKVLMG